MIYNNEDSIHHGFFGSLTLTVITYLYSLFSCFKFDFILRYYTSMFTNECNAYEDVRHFEKI